MTQKLGDYASQTLISDGCLVVKTDEPLKTIDPKVTILVVSNQAYFHSLVDFKWQEADIQPIRFREEGLGPGGANVQHGVYAEVWECATNMHNWESITRPTSCSSTRTPK